MLVYKKTRETTYIYILSRENKEECKFLLQYQTKKKLFITVLNNFLRVNMQIDF